MYYFDMKKRIIYHGSINNNVIPDYYFQGYGKDLDYGKGFYCTEDISAAGEWACKEQKPGFINKYEIIEDNLKILDLTDKHYSILNWIAVLVIYRNDYFIRRPIYSKEIEFLKKYLIDINDFDVVIGYRADDAYFAFPKEFLNNNITLEGLEKIYHLGYLGKQYVLISKKAFDSVTFIESIPADERYINAYKKRIFEAVNSFEKIMSEERYADGTRMRDLIRNAK